MHLVTVTDRGAVAICAGLFSRFRVIIGEKDPKLVHGAYAISYVPVTEIRNVKAGSTETLYEPQAV